MIVVKVLGSGCSNCKRLEQIVRQVLENEKIQADVIKVVNFDEIMKYPILATPALVINEKLVSAGRIPGPVEVTNWLSAAKNS